MSDRHEQGSLVDCFDDCDVVGNDDDFEVGLRLVQVTDGREVALLVHDAVAPRVERVEAREDDRLGDRDVLVHDRRARPGADDAPDLVADRDRHLPPAFGPRADAARLPRVRVLEHARLCGFGHRAERVVDQIGRVPEDREPIAVVRQLHGLSVLADS